MLRAVFLIFLLVSMNTYANDSTEISKSDLLKTLKNVKLEKSHMLQMINLMEGSGSITSSEADKARDQLNKMQDKDINDIQKKAMKKLKENYEPGSNQKSVRILENAKTTTQKESVAKNTSQATGKNIDTKQAEEQELKDAVDYLNQ